MIALIIVKKKYNINKEKQKRIDSCPISIAWRNVINQNKCLLVNKQKCPLGGIRYQFYAICVRYELKRYWNGPKFLPKEIRLENGSGCEIFMIFYWFMMFFLGVCRNKRDLWFLKYFLRNENFKKFLETFLVLKSLLKIFWNQSQP